MDLTVQDIADLLNVPSDHVEGLASEGKIPSYKINGALRFDPMEVEGYVMRHELQKSSRDTAHTQKGRQQFSLYRALFRGGVHLNIEGESKNAIIENTTEKLAPKLDLDANIVTELLLDREKLAPTAIGHGIAIPHTREIVLENSRDLIAVVFPKEPIAYGALDGIDVHTMFFLFASESKQHLHLLSKIAHMISDPKWVEFLKSKPSLAELLSETKKWELSLSQD